jgi:hypothetical protein
MLAVFAESAASGLVFLAEVQSFEFGESGMALPNLE